MISLKRRDFLLALGLGSFAVTNILPAACGSDRYDLTRPNILLILADDLGWSDLGCYGGEIQTPNLDRLAYSGIRFTQFRNAGKCFPSRACLLTGLYAQQCGMSEQPVAMRNAVTLAEVLRSVGYRTFMVGKHHGTDNPYDRGFERYYGLRDGAANHFNPGLPRPGEAVPAQKRPGQRVWCFDSAVVQPYTPSEPDFYSTDAYTQWALEFLEQYQTEVQDDFRNSTQTNSANQPSPFFLYLSYQAPHDPLQAWPEDIAKYEGVYQAGYGAIAQARYQRQQDMGLIDDRFPRSQPTHRPWSTLTEEERADQALRMMVYAAMIDRMDRGIGQVLDKIQSMGASPNTLILFASDNGSSHIVVEKGNGEIGTMTRWASLGADWANVSNVPLRYFKNYSHEGGICTPFLASWPAVIRRGGGVSSANCHFIDVMATFLAITGATYPESYRDETIVPYEGESFLPILQSKKGLRRGEKSAADLRQTPLFWEWSQGKAVLDGEWK